MNTLKLSMIAVAATLSFSSIAQDKKVEKERGEKKSKTIVITQDGDEAEKMTIVVDGEKVTVNGKPVEDYKGKVSVIKNKSTWVSPKGGARALVRSGDFPSVYSFGASKAFLGVTTEDVDGGAKITEVSKESAAEKAGLKVGDVITKIGDFNVADEDDVFAAMGKMKPEQKVNITFKRDGKQQTAEAILGKNKFSSNGFALADADFDFESFSSGDGHAHSFFSRRAKLGLQIQDVEEGTGVQILDVDEETPAAKAGLQKDDVIVELNGKEVKGVDDVRNEARALKEGDVLKVKFRRGSNTQNAEIKFPKRLKKADL